MKTAHGSVRFQEVQRRTKNIRMAKKKTPIKERKSNSLGSRDSMTSNNIKEIEEHKRV
jgi:hypothetical protein